MWLEAHDYVPPDLALLNQLIVPNELEESPSSVLRLSFTRLQK